MSQPIGPGFAGEPSRAHKRGQRRLLEPRSGHSHFYHAVVPGSAYVSSGRKIRRQPPWVAHLDTYLRGFVGDFLKLPTPSVWNVAPVPRPVKPAGSDVRLPSQAAAPSSLLGANNGGNAESPLFVVTPSQGRRRRRYPVSHERPLPRVEEKYPIPALEPPVPSEPQDLVPLSFRTPERRSNYDRFSSAYLDRLGNPPKGRLLEMVAQLGFDPNEVVHQPPSVLRATLARAAYSLSQSPGPATPQAVHRAAQYARDNVSALTNFRGRGRRRGGCLDGCRSRRRSHR